MDNFLDRRGYTSIFFPLDCCYFQNKKHDSSLFYVSLGAVVCIVKNDQNGYIYESGKIGTNYATPTKFFFS